MITSVTNTEGKVTPSARPIRRGQPYKKLLYWLVQFAMLAFSILWMLGSSLKRIRYWIVAISIPLSPCTTQAVRYAS